MFNRFIRARMAAFERRYDYDMTYARNMLAVSRPSFLLFSRVSQMAQVRDGLPLSAMYAAKLATSMEEDCGPCTQLIVNMAEQARVPESTIRAIVGGDVSKMDPDAALAWNFSRATLAHDAAADEYRDEIVKRWGEQAVISLALLIAGTRIFPTIKYAMGYGKACQRVRVGNVQQPIRSASVDLAG